MSFSRMVGFQFFGELVLFQGMGIEFRDILMLHCFREVKCQLGYTLKEFDIGYLIFRNRFPEGATIQLLFNCDIVNFLLKTNVENTESLILLFLKSGVFKLSFGGCWCCEAEGLIQSRLKLYPLCSCFIQGWGKQGESKISSFRF